MFVGFSGGIGGSDWYFRRGWRVH